MAGPGGGSSGASIGGAGGKGEGGGIYATNGPLVVSDSVIDGNKVVGGSGGSAPGGSGAGGIALGGGLAVVNATLTLAGTTVAINTASGGQAGLTNATGVQAAAGADAFGGGAFLTGADSLVNATVGGNLADGSAGGIGSSSPPGIPGRGFGGGLYAQLSTTSVVLASDTVAANAVRAEGGGGVYGGNLEDTSATVTVSNTIFSRGVGSPTTGNCATTRQVFTDAGNNLESTTPSQCGLTLASNRIGVDPKLAAFAYNGGLGPTLALVAASPARGAGGSCRDPSQPGDPLLTIDGRGDARPAPCDIGAYQFQPSPTSAGHSR